MRRDAIDWQGGEIIYWGFPDVGGDRWDLREDLLLVDYGGGVALDVGWYPELDPEGRYVVQVVCDDRWDAPLLAREARTERELEAALSEAIAVAAARRRG